MLPLEDQPEQAPGSVEYRRVTPYVTYALVILNVLVFWYELSLPPLALREFIGSWGVVPAELAVDSPRAYATLLTSMFIHGSFLHIFGNLLFLWVFGDNVEQALGHFTFLAFYLVCGILASLAQAALFAGSQVPAIGASGAIAGVLAGYLLLYPRAPVRLLLFVGPFLTVGRAAALLPIGIWFVMQFFQGVLSLGASTGDTGGIAYIAHVGGFLTGAALTLVIRRARGQRLGTFTGGYLWGPFFRNWLILIGVLLALIGGGALLAGAGSPGLGSLLKALAIVLAGLVALVDGVIRLLGRLSLLGPGRGTGRVLAGLQVLAALGLMLGLLG